MRTPTLKSGCVGVENRKSSSIFAGLVFLALVIFRLTPTLAQDDAPDFGTGLFEQTAEGMGGLLKIGIVNDRLRVQRGWDLTIARKKADDVPGQKLEEAIQKYIDRGLEREDAERMARHEIERGIRGHFDDNGVGAAFEDYRKSFGNINGSGGGGGGDSFRIYFQSQEFSANVRSSAGGDVRFEFEELTGDARRLSVKEIDRKTFNLNFIADNLLVDLRQDDGGSVRLAILGKEQAEVYRADGFAALVEKHPEPVNKVLFPLLQRLGIRRPISDVDNNVREAVLQRLTASTNDDMQVLALVEQLEADSFKARNEATDKLRNSYFIWQDLINVNMAEKSYSEEIQKQIKKITTGWPADEIHDFAQVNQLAESPGYLVKLLESAEPSEKQPIVSQLEKVTGEKIGNNIAEWNEWLKFHK